MVMMSSARLAASPTEVAGAAPAAASASTLRETKSKTTSSCPAFSKLRAMGAPMWPRPMKAIFI